MSQRWLESVEEHRRTIEAIAEAGGPLAEDMQQLLAEADSAGNDSWDE